MNLTIDQSLSKRTTLSYLSRGKAIERLTNALQIIQAINKKSLCETLICEVHCKKTLCPQGSIDKVISDALSGIPIDFNSIVKSLNYLKEDQCKHAKNCIRRYE